MHASSAGVARLALRRRTSILVEVVQRGGEEGRTEGRGEWRGGNSWRAERF